MSRLIKNEFIKIFKKKSIYITLLVILAFIILNSCMYRFFNHDSNSYEYSDNYISYVKQEIGKLDPNNPSDTSMYIGFKTNLEIFEMMNTYQEDAWQREIISSNLASYIEEKNTYLYGMNKDQAKVKEIEVKIQELTDRLKQDDWRYFAKTQLEQSNEALKDLEEKEKTTKDKQELETLKVAIENAKVDRQMNQYRVTYDIQYGSDFRNRALLNYQNQAKDVIQMEQNKETLTYQEKQQYNESIEKREINQYIIENNQDVNNTSNARGVLKNFDQYVLFILVMIIMVAGTIVSEEFNKGTIKLLLVKPYSRTKILLSKFITMLGMIAFSIVAVVAMEAVVGGIISGFDSFSVPVLSYNFTTQSLEAMNVFSYVGLQAITQLPMLILLATLAFAFSTIFNNSALAIVIALLGYMSTSVINQLAIMYQVDFMRFFVTMNWDLSSYLFGNLPPMEGMTFVFSLLINLFYFLIMIIPTFIVFKKKNIKNI